MFTINRHHEIPLVRNISINLSEKTELFERVSDNRIRIEENGQVAIQNASAVHTYTELRGKK